MLKLIRNNSLKTALRSGLLGLMLLALLLPVLAGAARAEGGSLRFDQNGEFKILLLADTQDVAKPQKEMLQLLEASLDAAQPDFVVYLGDMIHGNDIKSEESAEAAITAIVAPVVQRGLPFAVVFGNHDDNGGVSKEAQMEIYRSFPGCMAVDGEDLTGCGNYRIPLFGSDGEKAVFNFWFFDSGTYDPDREGAYDYVRQDQLDWYVKESNALMEENGGEAVPSFAFQHIIVPEIYDMLTEVPKGSEGAVRGHGSHSDRYYVLNPENFSSGSMGEGPCPPEYNSGEFAAWQQGDVIAAFFGHDHVNDFVGSYKGVDLVMTPGVGFYIYGNGDEHGTRAVTLHESDLENYDTELFYYKDLVGKAPFGIISTHGARYELPLVLAILLVLVVITVIILLVRRRKKRRKTA